MEKILSVELNSKLKIECWTYYKLSIIQTLPNYMNWLSSHINIYAGEMGEGVYFGTSKPHPPSYYSDILSIEEIDLYNTDVNEIVDKIKIEINNDCYYVLFLRNENGFSHEALIYGYSDKHSVFYTISMNENNQFSSHEISYTELINGYRNDYNYYIDNPEQYYHRHDFGYVMSRIKPIMTYANKNYAEEYFGKICFETYGTRTDICDCFEFNSFSKTCSYYTGIACLIYIYEKILKIFNNDAVSEDDLIVIKKNMFKLYEHRQLNLDALIWYETQWNITDTVILNARQQYAEACVEMHTICMLFLKYTVTREDNLLKYITKKIINQYTVEKSILISYILKIREWFTSNVLKNRLIEGGITQA